MFLAISQHSNSIDITVGGIIIGLLLGALIYVVCAWLAGETGFALLRPIGAIVAVLVFVLLAFGIG